MPALEFQIPNGSSPRVRGTRKEKMLKKHKIPVHPRGCGEHRPLCFRSRPLNGSSPRVRGTPRTDRLGTVYPRFIPAGAGNTGFNRFSRPIVTVHPRGCGEHGQVGSFGGHSTGSSPRVRGTQSEEGERAFAWRFIPAGAGNTTSPAFLYSVITVHPRGCGEHRAGGRKRRQSVGSSPRVRGTPRPNACTPIPDRFIPAGAGNTLEFEGWQ